MRVEWHTDIRNERSQAAIERLGATREGVLRRHKQRPDGTWRDTVHYSMTVDEWPNAQATAAGKASRTPHPVGVRMAGMLGITDIWTYVLGTVAIILLPGPNSLFVLSTAARRGVAVGYRAAAGVFLGDWVLMVALRRRGGVAAQGVPAAFLVIKYAGRGLPRLCRADHAARRLAALARPPRPGARRG